jgi:hypothetical protein
MSILIKGITIEQFHKDLNTVDDMDVEWVIKQLPPHGRLIDADKVINRINMNIDLYGDFPITHERMRRFIEYAPTIVEAEGDDNG